MFNFLSFSFLFLFGSAPIVPCKDNIPSFRIFRWFLDCGIHNRYRWRIGLKQDTSSCIILDNDAVVQLRPDIWVSMNEALWVGILAIVDDVCVLNDMAGFTSTKRNAIVTCHFVVLDMGVGDPTLHWIWTCARTTGESWGVWTFIACAINWRDVDRTVIEMNCYRSSNFWLCDRTFVEF